MINIPFNKPAISENALDYIRKCFNNSSFENGYFTQLATQSLIEMTQAKSVLLTTSCTAALEIAALLLDIKPDDEIIMSSYTFVSTANAFVLRGAKPVFVDIRPDTLNLDENLIEAAITEKTKAIVPMHYAGVGCEMEVIQKIAEQYQLSIIEDAAQAVLAFYKNKHLGTFGRMAAFSFHHTKNITAGFGGALLVNDEQLLDRAKILWQKGTNREAFIAGNVDKYTWVDLGSAFLLNEINAALLYSQLEQADQLIKRRLKIWNKYHYHFNKPENRKKIQAIPSSPAYTRHNAHIYYLILNSPEARMKFIQGMKESGIDTPFHYIPLHSSPGGIRYGQTHHSLKWTEHCSQRLVRLPIYADLSEEQTNYIIETTNKYL